MKDQQGRDMVRLGDRTDHGGEVIECAADLKHLGVGVALEGNGVRCPKCSGVFPLLATGRRRHHGRRVGYLGDTTRCGATLIRR